MNRTTIKTSLCALAGAFLLSGAVASAQNSCMPMPKGDTSAQDKKFLMNASEGGLFVVTASKIALKKSNNPDVKAFAQKMVDDHTKLAADLMPFDQKMMVTPATRLSPAHQQEARRLKSMSGDKFNTEYVKAMDADHHKDRGDFRNERDTTSNADLKATVSQGYDVIKEHTDMIDGLATKMNLPVPADSAPISTAPSM